ncbi:MAG TPA: PA2169 family four-helix-bundle protein [Anaerolineae bacterium]
MTTTNKRVVKTLNHLYRICHAGERGFETAAENVSNRGLKVLLKHYAHQRRQFAATIQAEIERIGGKPTQRASILGIIHRGRMAIIATLTIGPENTENVVLKEAELGEQAAVEAYKKALEKEMPAETKSLINHQYEEIQTVREQLVRLRGRSGRRLIVRLFDSDEDKEEAIQALQRAGFDADVIKTASLREAVNVYEGQGSTVTDTVISGAVGGAIWGSILGAAAGGLVLLVPDLSRLGATTLQELWATVALSGTVIGAFFGVILGFLIGVAVSGEDAYLYDDSVEHGSVLVMVKSGDKRSAEASQIMRQVNVASRERRGMALPEYK